MIGDLADLDVGAVRRLARDAQSGGLQQLFVLAIEFVAMAMALADLARAVSLAGETASASARRATRPAAWCRPVRPRPSVRAICKITRCGVRGIELGGIGVVQAADVARELDHHGLHAQADAEIRDLAARGHSGWR